MSLDNDKWRKFQDAALKSLIFAPDSKTIFRIKVIDSFAPSVSWRIAQTSQKENETNHFAEFRQWRSDIDQEKFRLPVELLKYRGSLEPTIEAGKIEFANDFAENSMNRFKSLKIPPFVEMQSFGLDGSTTEIEFGNGFLNSKFSWWNNAPEEWKHLGNVVEDVLNYLNSKSFF